MPIQWGLDNDSKVVKEGNKVTNLFVAYWEYS